MDIDRRIKLAKQYFKNPENSNTMKRHKHFCPIHRSDWEHESTRCGSKGHRNKICSDCIALKEMEDAAGHYYLVPPAHDLPDADGGDVRA